MVGAAAITGVLGLAFWAAAARLFPAHEVGVASALLSSAIMLASFSNLSLGSMFDRFIPQSGTRAGALLIRGYLAASALAVVLACGLIWLGPSDVMFTETWQVVGYPILVVVLAVFALQDNTAASLGVARWGAYKNTLHSIVKLVAIVALATAGSASTIVFAWGLTAAVGAAWLAGALRRRVRADRRFALAPNLPPRQELWSYFGSSYGITALGSIAPLIVPLVVVAQLGAEDNAYFAVSWSMVSAAAIMIGLLVGPFVAESAAHPDKAAELAGRFVKMIGAVAVLGGLGLAFVGPVILGFIGEHYETHGTPLLRIAGVFLPLLAVSSAYDGLARVHRRLRLALAMQCVSTAVIVCGTFAMTSHMGVDGVGYAFLLAQFISAAILLVPLLRWLRELGVGR